METGNLTLGLAVLEHRVHALLSDVLRWIDDWILLKAQLVHRRLQDVPFRWDTTRAATA
jgi:hypothetical protein